MALTASSMVPNAVSKMTSTSGTSVFAARSSSMPVRPGIFRSLKIRSSPPLWMRSSAARPSGARTTWYPARVSVRCKLSRSPGSSSATRSVGPSDTRGSLDGDTNGEGRAGARLARPRQLAAVLLRDLAGDGESEAGALRLRGEEVLEEPLADFGRDAGPGVGHGGLDVLAMKP